MISTSRRQNRAVTCLFAIAAIAASCAGQEPGISESRHIGHFEKAGEYMKDFFFLKAGDTYHLFYNVGKASPNQNWLTPGNEDAFGHATSQDLKTWVSHKRVMHVVPNSWEGQTVSAPSILKVDDTYKMIYTGFSDKIHGNQTIGLAESKDLFHWERYENNPVYTGPSWTTWNAHGWADCRDSHIIQVDDRFLMYTTVRSKENRGSVAIARSADQIDWEDLGPAFFVDVKNERGDAKVPESPTVFDHNGKYYMIPSQGACYRSEDPAANNWKRMPFAWPQDGFWAGLEVVREEDRYIAGAFVWKPNGNHIRFWELTFVDGRPVIQY